MRICKSKLNLVIDIVMFINMMVLVGIGFLIKYVLIPGSQRNVVYGRDIELYFWGLDRHQWGYIHLITGFVLLFLLLLHIVFHWKMILCIYRNLIPRKYLRVFSTIIFVIVSLLLGLVPLFLKPELREDEGHHYHRKRHESEHTYNTDIHKTSTVSLSPTSEDTLKIAKPKVHDNSEGRFHRHEQEHHIVEIYGSMTLHEVATKYKVPVSELASCIHVPISRANERLGRLRKEYGFHLDDLRDYVELKGVKAQ